MLAAHAHANSCVSWMMAISKDVTGFSYCKKPLLHPACRISSWLLQLSQLLQCPLLLASSRCG